MGEKKKKLTPWQNQGAFQSAAAEVIKSATRKSISKLPKKFFTFLKIDCGAGGASEVKASCP